MQYGSVHTSPKMLVIAAIVVNVAITIVPWLRVK